MIGRKQEIALLNKLYRSEKPELVAVYGRRRVGKTYLVNQVFGDKFTFSHTGLSPIEKGSTSKKDQLEAFSLSLRMYGWKDHHVPSDWLEAFFMLESFLRDQDTGERQVVFLDELPWMDTRKSGFVRAFEWFWNNWCNKRNNIMVIVCGSSTSWILDKVIYNHDGLYNRVTSQIKLSPFTLQECEEYYQSMDFRLSRYDIVQSHMILGGIPFYMSCCNPELSFAQNIDHLLFRKTSPLRKEYELLFSSVFTNAKDMRTIVEFLYTKNAGYTRKEIAEGIGVSDGGNLSDKLKALVASDYVIEYIPFGISGKTPHYKLVDPFCLFYLHFAKDQRSFGNDYWISLQASQAVVSWRGFAFENVCFHHIDQIKAALKIQGVLSKESAWSKRSDDTEGTQIDLLIERNDNVVNSCELKFYSDEFTVDKKYYMVLLKRQGLLKEKISRKAAIHNTLITTYGLKRNEYSSIFSKVIVMDDLFQ